MDIYTFLSLSQKEQARVVLAACFLADKEEEGSLVKLFAIDDFYVEVFYTLKDSEAITKLKAFKSRRLLLPYLDNFHIEEFA